MHRQIRGLRKGDGIKVDHRSHDTLDNRRSNLRVSSNVQNHHNMRPKRGKAVPFKGVYLFKRTGKFHAQIKTDKVRHLGSFKKARQAARCYDSAARRAFGTFAYTNFDEKGKRNAA